MLNEYYKKIINNIGLFTDDEGFIYGGDPENKILITTLGKPLVLPTEEHVKTIFTDDPEEGIIINKILYNPLNEEVIKKDSESLAKTKLVVETRIALMLEVVGELLLHLASNKVLQTKTSLNLNKFLGSINDAKRATIKNLIDDNVINNWSKLCKASRSNGNSSIKIYLKKGGVAGDGVKYTRLATISVTALEHLLKAEKDEQVLGVTLRPKDIRLFIILYNFLLNVENKHTIELGSNSTESPGFMSLMELYINIGTRLENLLRDLKDVAVSIESLIEPVIDMKVDELKEVDHSPIIKQELLSLPNEIDLNRQVEAKRKTAIIASDLNSNLNKPRAVASNPILAEATQQVTQPVLQQVVPQQVTQPVVQQQVIQQAPTNQALSYNPNTNMDPVHSILSKTGNYMQVMEKQAVNPNMINPNMMNPNMMTQQQYVNPNMVPNQQYVNPNMMNQNMTMGQQQYVNPQQQMIYAQPQQQQMLYTQPQQQLGYAQPQQQMMYAQPQQQMGYAQPQQQMMYMQPQQQVKPMGISGLLNAGQSRFM